MNEHTAFCSSPLNVVFAFLVGGLVGAGAGILLAPGSGRTTRERIRRDAGETVASARDLTDRLVRRSQQVADEARHRVTEAAAALAGDESVKVPV
jgi:gas vesicle protein